MTKPKSGLGRGLSALIPQVTSGVDDVDIDLVVPNPQQPRTAMEPEALEELAESIRTHGIIQPLLVSRTAGPRGGTIYQLIAGERRLQAARLAGLARVPIVVREAAPRDLLELALVENVQRQDLTPLEEAQAYRRLIDEFHLTQEAVAGQVGRSRVTVTNALRLLSLPSEVKLALASGQITEGHARALLGLETNPQRIEACQMVVRDGLTVRETEELVRRWNAPVALPTSAAAPASAAKKRRGDADVAAIEESLRNILGTKVLLVRGRKGGRLVIHFYSDDDLEGLLDILTGQVGKLR
ncbi:MAG: ParB/RepB/Spo0J family partition protein [Dehalococcoidia bacterium]|nr:ParB/RepB/Spo0J family partition protein [Dehalococcoidia bacterium]